MKLSEFREKLIIIENMLSFTANDLNKASIRFGYEGFIALMQFYKGYNGKIYCAFIDTDIHGYISDEPLGMYIPTYYTFYEALNLINDKDSFLEAEVIVIKENITMYIRDFCVEIKSLHDNPEYKITINYGNKNN